MREIRLAAKEADEARAKGADGQLGHENQHLLPAGKRALAEGKEMLKDPYGITSSALKNKDWYSFLLLSVTWDFGERCRTCNNAKNIEY